MNRLHTLFAVLTFAAPFAADAQEPSAYGCTGLEFSTALPTIEGRDGVFYRTFADLRLQHPMDDRVVGMLGRLAGALSDHGTTLVFATIPSKSVAMPQFLPAHAADYGFDVTQAEQIYGDIITRLNDAGVVAPDILSALQSSPDTEPPFFGADFHWTSDGARRAAQAIGAAIKAHPAYAELTPSEFTSQPGGVKPAFSGMRRTLQSYCTDALPPVETMSYVTTKVDAGESGEEAAALDIFAASETAPQLVLVGTSFSDSSVNNFAGFLAEYSGLEVVNYAVTGGNQFGAMTSYLTSEDFVRERPTFIVWENPIYNNLAQFGTHPLEELIAAAGTGCTHDLKAVQNDDGSLTASLDGLDVKAGDAIFADYGGEGARTAEFVFQTSDDITRRTTMERGQRLRATGNFFLGMSAFLHPGYQSVSVRFDRPPTDDSRIFLCTDDKGDAS
jgi:alginate biosynthesis protein AlgX